jgi:hypothetical protein
VTASTPESSGARRQHQQRTPPHRPASACGQPEEQRRGAGGRDKRPERACSPRSGYCGRGCHHPHIHCLVPAGGLADNGQRWRAPKKIRFFLPVKPLSRLFRNKFLCYLQEAFAAGQLAFYGQLRELGHPANFRDLVSRLADIDWVAYVKPPFGGPDQVLRYLARYTHRVAISNGRLLSLQEGHVHFRWRDSRDGNRTKEMSLAAAEFIRRFLMHVLPPGFVKNPPLWFPFQSHPKADGRALPQTPAVGIAGSS